MSLMKIKAALKKAKSDAIGFSWVDEEFSELLIAIAEHILQKESISIEEATGHIPPGYISIKEFEATYKFVAANTLYKLCKDNSQFAENCAYRDGLHWYINPKPAIDYLKNRRIFKKRLERLCFS